MRVLIALLAVAALCVLLTGCAGMMRAPVIPGMGMIYADYKAPLQVDYDNAAIGDKMGEATSEDVLGWICTGDASVDAAAKAGNIDTITHVDYKFWNILGIYSKYTTVVYGK